MPVILIGIFIVTDILKLTGREPDGLIGDCIDFTKNILQVLCFYTLAIVLRRHGEGFLRVLPLYLLMLLLTLSTLKTVAQRYINNDRAEIFQKTQPVLLILVGIIAIIFMISIFNVKNTIIKRYFRLYGLSLICSGVASVLIKNFYSDSEFWYQYGLFLNHIIVILPIAAIFFMHYSLFNKYEVFKAGDSVITKIELENIWVGAPGIILKKHSNSNYYEVEFVDDDGNLLNVLSVSANDFEHAAQPDLETRVNTFGLLK